MSRPKLGERDRRAVLLGSAVLLAGLLLRAAVLPYAGALRDAGERLERERALLQREERMLHEAESHRRAFGELGTRLLASVPRLMTGGTLAATQATLAGRVDRAASAAPALLRRVEPLPSRSAGPGVRAIPLRVEGESDFEGVMTLLAELESGPSVYHVAELELRAREEGGGSTPGAVVLSFRFTVTGFVLEEPE